jgi:hypothetical protein
MRQGAGRHHTGKRLNAPLRQLMGAPAALPLRVTLDGRASASRPLCARLGGEGGRA